MPSISIMFVQDKPKIEQHGIFSLWGRKLFPLQTRSIPPTGIDNNQQNFLGSGDSYTSLYKVLLQLFNHPITRSSPQSNSECVARGLAIVDYTYRLHIKTTTCPLGIGQTTESTQGAIFVFPISKNNPGSDCSIYNP